MSMEEQSFKEYKENVFSRRQKSVLLIGWFVAGLTLLLEIFNYTVLLKKGERVEASFRYILIRVITPSLINIVTLTIATIIQKSDKAKMDLKNLWCSISIFMICSVIGVFHSYFQILLVVPAITFFVISIFSDIKILNRIFIASIIVFFIECITFWLDPASGVPVYKILTLFCAAFFIFCAFIFSRALIKAQAQQLNYMHQSYRKQSELIEELKIEPLTKLYNRIAMDGTISRILARKGTTFNKSFLVILDLDFFKRVNDKYGHTAGDEVLITLADIVKAQMGSVRKTFRFGGEEFVLIFEDNFPSTVIYTIEEIRGIFSSTKFAFAPEESFTLSGGVAPLLPEYDEKMWLDAADRALYYAKNHGRNQIKIFDENC